MIVRGIYCIVHLLHPHRVMWVTSTLTSTYRLIDWDFRPSFRASAQHVCHGRGICSWRCRPGPRMEIWMMFLALSSVSLTRVGSEMSEMRAHIKDMNSHMFMLPQNQVWPHLTNLPLPRNTVILAGMFEDLLRWKCQTELCLYGVNISRTRHGIAKLILWFYK